MEEKELDEIYTLVEQAGNVPAAGDVKC